MKSNTTGLLKFSNNNAKLGKNIYTLSLVSGFSCPGAKDCLAKADPKTGKITDGPNTKFRCFSASQEAVYKNVREQRWYNFKLLQKAKTTDKIKNLILKSLPPKAKIIRHAVAGDFYNLPYFDAWIQVAKSKPDILFYAYTKSLNFWVKRLGQIPKNLKLTASEGGRYDHLIKEHDLKYAKVVFSEEEAEKLGLEVDEDDSHAYSGDKSFALKLHGVQAANSPASKALSALKLAGFTGYSRKIPLKTVEST